jgi:hypothetical protein
MPPAQLNQQSARPATLRPRQQHQRRQRKLRAEQVQPGISDEPRQPPGGSPPELLRLRVRVQNDKPKRVDKRQRSELARGQFCPEHLLGPDRALITKPA